jgi:hypothetical protein
MQLKSKVASRSISRSTAGIRSSYRLNITILRYSNMCNLGRRRLLPEVGKWCAVHGRCAVINVMETNMPLCHHSLLMSSNCPISQAALFSCPQPSKAFKCRPLIGHFSCNGSGQAVLSPLILSIAAPID